MFSYSSLIFEKDQLREFLLIFRPESFWVVSCFGDLQYEIDKQYNIYAV